MSPCQGFSVAPKHFLFSLGSQIRAGPASSVLQQQPSRAGLGECVLVPDLDFYPFLVKEKGRPVGSAVGGYPQNEEVECTEP